MVDCVVKYEKKQIFVDENEIEKKKLLLVKE